MLVQLRRLQLLLLLLQLLGGPLVWPNLLARLQAVAEVVVLRVVLPVLVPEVCRGW
jgi:hypothetical protein